MLLANPGSLLIPEISSLNLPHAYGKTFRISIYSSYPTYGLTTLLPWKACERCSTTVSKAISYPKSSFSVAISRAQDWLRVIVVISRDIKVRLPRTSKCALTDPPRIRQLRLSCGPDCIVSGYHPNDPLPLCPRPTRHLSQRSAASPSPSIFLHYTAEEQSATGTFRLEPMSHQVLRSGDRCVSRRSHGTPTPEPCGREARCAKR